LHIGGKPGVLLGLIQNSRSSKINLDQFKILRIYVYPLLSNIFLSVLPIFVFSSGNFCHANINLKGFIPYTRVVYCWVSNIRGYLYMSEGNGASPGYVAGSDFGPKGDLNVNIIG
jgi:hypothetical protein